MREEPNPWREISKRERQLVRSLFRERYVNWFVFRKQYPPLSISRIFWKRARGDAHVTYTCFHD